MKKWLVLIIFISNLLYSNNAYEQAMLHIENKNYTQAGSILLDLSNKTDADIHKKFSIAGNLIGIGFLDQALAIFSTLLQKHHSLSIMYNSAFTLKCMGKNDEAINLYKKILTHDPNHEQAHLGLAFSYLMKGDYETGWKHHIWNLQQQNKDSLALRRFLANETIKEKKILLKYEGGLGDSLQFIRYAYRLKQLGATITACVQKPLYPLFLQCPYIDQLIIPGMPTSSYDAVTTLMAAPAIMQDQKETVAIGIPYLFANPELINNWQQTFKNNTHFKIGICWQADLFNDSSRMPIAHRGIPLKILAHISTIKNVSLYSLQKSDGLDQLAQLPAEIPLSLFDSDYNIFHFTQKNQMSSEFDTAHGPFMDSAAIMQHLDLIITVDSAVAHLAGALGRPVFLLLPYVIDWRWLSHNHYSPWYPSMCVFQQPHPFDWQSVINEVIVELKNRIPA